MSNSKRVEWVDGLKGFLILTVILLHCDAKADSIYTDFLKWCTSFHMLCFFFLSGLWFKKTELSSSNYFWNKAKTLLIPYLIYGVLIGLPLEVVRRAIQGNDIMPKTLLLDALLGHITFSPTWFLLSLFIIYIVEFYISKLKDRRIRITVQVGLLILGIALPTGVNGFFRIKSTLIGLFYFGMGSELKTVVITKHYKAMPYISILLLLLGIMFCYMNGRVVLSKAVIGNPVLFLLSSWFTIFGVCFLFRWFWELNNSLFKPIKSLLCFWGYHSIIILCLHEYVILSGRMIEKIIFGKLYCLDVGIMFLYTAALCFPLILFANKYLLVTFGKPSVERENRLDESRKK